MNPIIRNLLALFLGLVVCMLVNGGLIAISGSVVPPPEGVDPNDLESIKAHIDLYRPIHFLFPFLAHALGSLVGAFLAARIAVSRQMTLALVVGGVHMLGGIMASFMIPAPAWFIALDLGVAYLPMAWTGGMVALRTARP